MTIEDAIVQAPILAAPAASPPAPRIYRLIIERFRGIKMLSWYPARGANVILGGGDVGKTTILDAIALLFSPTNSTNLSDSDYHGRDIAAGFVIEAIVALPPGTGISEQAKPSWPWEWTGTDVVVPPLDGEQGANQPVYRLRVRGTEDLELSHEVVQPDGTPDSLPVALRRAIGLVRLSGDDCNDRDLRLVQGSALDRLLSDKGLRSRIASELAKTEVKGELAAEALDALGKLDHAFKKENLPDHLDLSITGGPGPSIASLIGLTAARGGVQLPLAMWGAGTRRLAALAIAEQRQGDAPITIVDEIERGLEPYRQRALTGRLQKPSSQVFATTHSPFVLAAAEEASFWYVDHNGRIGALDGKKIATVRRTDPATFLSRLAIIAEGITEVGFLTALLEGALAGPLDTYGIHICDGGSNETTLELLEALSDGGLSFAGFADNENKHPTRWKNVEKALGPLLFRWSTGCLEKNIIALVPDDKLEMLLNDPEDEKTGVRLRTLAMRLDIEQKDFATVATTAQDLRMLITEAALGAVPANMANAPKGEKKSYEKHAQDWFKTKAGGRELERKVFAFGLWTALRDQLLPFCNAVRKAVGLADIADLQL
jgi:putative ATP-dependent endonuclease of the OLD family